MNDLGNFRGFEFTGAFYGGMFGAHDGHFVDGGMGRPGGIDSAAITPDRNNQYPS